MLEQPWAERVNVFHSKENNELSKGLDLPGFPCRMVLTFSQKTIPSSSFPV